MNLGRLLLVWTARHLLALVLIVLILIAARVFVPPVSGWVQKQVQVARTAPQQRAALAQALDRYHRYSKIRKVEGEKAVEALRAAPEARLRQRRAALGPAISRQRSETLTRGELALATVGGDANKIFQHYRTLTEIQLLESELRLIDGLLATRAAELRRTSLAERRRLAVHQLRTSRARWQAARSQVDRLNRRPLAPARNFVCRTAPLGVGCENYRALAQANREMRTAAADHRAAQRQVSAIDSAVRALAGGRQAPGDVAAVFEEGSAALRADLAQVDRAARDNWLVWTKSRVLEVLPAALAILAAAILAPPFLKALLYFLVAPLAARRPPLRLLHGERGSVSATGAAPSRTVPLQPGQELLIVPEAIQSTPQGADKRTKWLLDWSMPLSSLAAGMVALVQLRVRSADAVVASATAGPVAEIALIGIGEGSAMVLRPRALRGVIQPVDRRIMISRHWRLLHLSTWLTFQFRYLVFHGPCTLIVEGARGVRLEAAGAGRSINQAATLGFSAGLAYSVARSEAFGAYLLGRQELFNDSFGNGSGYYLYEEVPREGTRGGPWGRGLRGLGDAALKMFGL